MHIVHYKEYGTNRPTPFTIPDKEDDPSNKKDVKSSTEDKKAHQTESLLSPRIFTDDASDIIGSLFFGPLPPGSNSRQGSVLTGSKNADRSIVRNTSFGSISTMSTMTSAKGRTTRGVTPGGDDDNLFSDDENVMSDAQEESIQIIGWDQDEIDLWTSNRNDEKAEAKNEIPTEEQVEEDWVSQRRRLLDSQKKRFNWDELGPGISLTPQVQHPRRDGEIKYDGLTSMDIIEAQRILKTTQPGEKQNSNKTTAYDARDGEQYKRKGGGAVIVDDGKQHWMPDSLCKTCYACEAPFTLLRRKHHCRLCGMIFW